MLTVSLHKIQVHALLGLYQQEQILHNHFEADLDVQVPAGPADTWPMIDYSRLNTLVREAFLPGDELLETLVRRIYNAIRRDFPEAGNIKVTLRKMNPPMPGNIAYAQVMFEA